MLNYVETELKTLKEKFAVLKALLQDVEAQDKSKIDLETDLNLEIDITIAEFISRLEATLHLIDGLQTENDSSLIPFSVVKQLDEEITDTATKIDTVVQNFENAKQNGGITAIQGDALEIHTPNGNQFSLIPNLSGLFSASDELLRTALEIHKLVSSKGFSDFTSILQSWSSAFAKISKERAEMAAIIEEVRGKRDNVLEAHKNASEGEKQIQEMAAAAITSNQQKQKEIDEINAKISQIREITKDADTLKTTVDGYEAQFESFDKAMESRNKNYDTNKQNLDSAIEYVDESKALIEERIQKSEQMLSGATVAGLASKFGELHGKLEEQLNKAARAFYISIGLLVLTCLPILDYFFPIISHGIFGAEFTNALADTRDSYHGLLVRAILLLPASWLTIFNARKYANLFKLKEHYAYKYSIAASVEGFKHQSPQYKDEIAFSAFYELTFNPASEIDGKKMVAKHPIRDFSISAIEEIKRNLPKVKRAVEPVE